MAKLSLSEIATALGPQKKEIEVSGLKFEVRGLSAAEIADVMARFPAFADALGSDTEANAKMGFEALGGAMKVVAAIGIGWVDSEGREAAETAAGSLRADTLGEIAKEVMLMTMPPGPGAKPPFEKAAE